MKFDDYQDKLELVMKLIEHGNTGSPKDLAKKLRVSERTTRRLVEKLKFRHKSIFFCRKSNSYLIKN
ncbi:hypothetical protein BH10BAC1_BH10BAC1_08690 [soil metagenome]